MRKQTFHKLLLVLGTGLLGFLFIFGSKPAAATNPNLISFQGKVVNSDGTNVANGTYSFNFVLFDDPSLGSESDGVHDKWHELGKSVPVTNGVFQTELGSSTALPDFSQFNALYLGVKFNGDTAGYMTPRIHLDSVPYAKYSDNAGALSGLVAGNFVQLAQGLQTDASTTNASIAINKTGGTANILQLQKSGSDVLTVNNNGDVTIQNASDSASALLLKNHVGDTVVNVDTTTGTSSFQGQNSVATLGPELAVSPICSGTNWVDNGDGTYTHTTGSTIELSCSPPANATSGSYYQIVINSSLVSAGNVIVEIGNNVAAFVYDNETNLTSAAKASTTAGLQFQPSSNFIGTVQIVSIKEITPTNAVLSVNNSNGAVGIEIRAGGSLGNTFIGIDSGAANISGSDNTAVGLSALARNTTGFQNNAFGEDALFSNTSGSSNNAFGDYSLEENVSGQSNNSFGTNALTSNSTGSFNNAVGDSALSSNTIGNANNAFGDNTLVSNTTGSGNTAIGSATLGSLGIIAGSSDNNTAVGMDAGSNIRNGSFNTFIGGESGNGDSLNNFFTGDNLQKATAIGAYSQVQQSNSLILGGAGADAVNVGIGTTSPTNLFSVAPDIYDTGTASVTSGTTAVTETGAIWNSNFAGMEIIFADGTKYTIASATSTTLTLSSNATVTETNKAYRIHNPAFYVSSTGSAGIRTSTNSTTAFQVQNAAGSSLITADTANSHVIVRASSAGTTALLVEQDNNSGSGLSILNSGSGNSLSTALSIEQDNDGTGFLLSNFGPGLAVDVRDSNNKSVVRIDSNNNQFILGQGGASGLNGTLVFNNSVGANTVGFSLQANPVSSYTLLLPTTGPGVSQCLQTDGTTANQLVFAACSTGGSGVTSVAYSTTANANGGSITGSVLTLAKADGTHPGLLSSDAQTIGGDKTFNGFVKIAGSGTRPSSPTAGTLYYDTSTNQLIQYNGSKWISAPRSSTFIVAASTSSQAAKDAADYVTTGTDDAAGINTNILGVAPCSTTGCSVYLEEGTYNLGTTSLNVPNNTTISGAGAGTLLKFANSVGSGTYYAIKNSDTATGTHVNIQNLMIDGNKSNNAPGNFYGIYFNGMGGGSGTSARDGGKVSNVVARSLNAYGIYLSSSSGNTIVGSTAQGNGNYGITLFNSNNNTVTGNTAQGNSFYGINIGSSSSNNTVSGNTVQGNISAGILLDSPYNTITGNTTQGNLYGIYLSGSTNDTISGNTVKSSGNYGIFLTNGANNNAVNGNKILDSGSTDNNGIYLSSSSSKNSITGNDITDSSCATTCYAINISDAGSIGNYLASNHFLGDGTNAASIGLTANLAGNTLSNQPLSENGDADFRNAVNSAAAFQVQNAAGYGILSVDTSSNSAQGQVMLGVASHNNGMLVFANSAGSNTVSLVSQAINPASSVSIFLPTAGATGTQCLQSTSGSTSTSTTLQFGLCGAGATSVSYSTTANASGGSIAGSVLTLAKADGSNPGLLSADAQTIGGDKTLQGSTTFAPTANNTGTTVKQTSGTATSGNVFDVQTANGTSHFIQIANSAANEGAVTIQSVGATRDLTIDSASGIVKLGGNSTSLQKSASSFTLDIAFAGASTLNVSNSNGSNVANLVVSGDVSAGTGHVFKVGATSGVGQTACSSGQFFQGQAATGGIITTAGTCTTAVTGVGGFSGSSQANGASLSGSNIVFGPADGTNPGMVTASGTQTFGGNKTFSGTVTVQAAGGITIGTTSTSGVLALYNGTNTVSIQGAGSTAAYSIILPANVAGAANQCLASTGSNGTLQWLPCGAGSTATVTLSPEYPGAVLTPVSGTNTGTMTSDFCSGSSLLNIPSASNPCGTSEEHTYYSWTAAAGNDYDIWVQWQAPSDFSSLSGITFYGQTTSNLDSSTITVYKKAVSSACGLAGTVATSGTWTTATPGYGSCSIAAGDSLFFDVNLSVGTSGEFARAGEIVINYNRK